MGSVNGAAYYRNLANEAELCGTCTRCNRFSLEFLRDDVCPTCEAYAAENGPADDTPRYGGGHDAAYRENMVSAGRGHLL